MRQRHWEEISTAIGFKLFPDKTFTLVKAEEMKLLDHLPAITAVSNVAGKEYSIEQVTGHARATRRAAPALGAPLPGRRACPLARTNTHPRARVRLSPSAQALDKMVAELEGAELQVLDYRETKTYVIRVDEAVSQMLDDHIVMTQSMSFSQYKKPFEERITKWELQLTLVGGTRARAQGGEAFVHKGVCGAVGLPAGVQNTHCPPATCEATRATAPPLRAGQRHPGAVGGAAAAVDVPGAHLQQRGHHAAAAAGGQALCHRGPHLAQDPGHRQAQPGGAQGARRACARAPVVPMGSLVVGVLCLVQGPQLGLGVRAVPRARMVTAPCVPARPSPPRPQVCGNQKLLDQFIEGNKLLESVQKGLADYLETKRLAFARFFFLSNDELLQARGAACARARCCQARLTHAATGPLPRGKRATRLTACAHAAPSRADPEPDEEPAGGAAAPAQVL